MPVQNGMIKLVRNVSIHEECWVYHLAIYAANIIRDTRAWQMLDHVILFRIYKYLPLTRILNLTFRK